MNYVVVDFEYNQPFNFKSNEKGKIIGDCPFEIIQIGAVKLNDDMKVIDRFNYYIKPQIYKRMHPFVEKITKISKGQLQNKKDFKFVYSNFLKFIDDESVLCFWGSNDLKELYVNARFHKLNYGPLPNRFIDVQGIASEHLGNPPGMAIGLQNAVESLELSVNLDFHDALNDAIYTAQVFDVVKKSKMRRVYFNIKSLNKSKSINKNYKVNNWLLYKEAERDFGRKLTKKEKRIIKKFYEFGKTGSFDNKNL